EASAKDPAVGSALLSLLEEVERSPELLPTGGAATLTLGSLPSDEENQQVTTTAPGQTLSHYRLISKIGEGGMGVVWKAEDTILGRPVAIKFLPGDTARNERRRKMFFDEARLASSLSEAH